MKQGRERLIAEQARAAEQQLNESNWRRMSERKLEQRADPMGGAVQRGLVRNIAGSLASENVVPIMDIAAADGWQSMVAWTDFDKIFVRYNRNPDPRVVAAVLRGLCFHEGGHIRWSIPFPELRDRARANDDDLDMPTGIEMREWQHAWNCLEDQRMETAVVSDSPRKAAFFVPMVLTELINTPDKATTNYPLLVWRRYLPQHIRDGARAMFVALNGETITIDIEACVDRYVKATTPVEMWDAVIEFTGLLRQLQKQPTPPDASSNHSKQPSYSKNIEEKLEIPVDPKMDASPAESGGENTKDDEGDEGAPAAAQGDESDDEQDGDAQGAGGSESDDEGDESGQGMTGGADEEGEGEGEGEGQSADAESEQATEGGSKSDEQGHGAGARDDEEADHSGLSQDDLTEAIKEADEARYNDRSLDADMDAFHDALSRQGSMLPPYPLVEDSDSDRSGQAEAIAEDLVMAFNMVTTDRLPSWVEGQRSGVLNVNRWNTRQPGDMDYFKQWVEDDIPGHNIAVSVLLDYSMSMLSSLPRLAVAGYACKLACQQLDIPCTVVLWDDDAKVLWDGMDEADYLPRIGAGGNTDPSIVLADIENHRFGKDRHLVLIMTDGLWSFEGRSLAPYQSDRIMLGVGYSPNVVKAEKYAKALKGYGCANSHGVTDLSVLPRLLEDLLIQMA
jgi:hypothetical protein